MQGRVFEVIDGQREPVAGVLVEISDDPKVDEIPDEVRTGPTGTFAFVAEWSEDSGIDEVTITMHYFDDDNNSNGDQVAIRTITVTDGDNEFVQDVTLE